MHGVLYTERNRDRQTKKTERMIERERGGTRDQSPKRVEIFDRFCKQS